MLGPGGGGGADRWTLGVKTGEAQRGGVGTFGPRSRARSTAASSSPSLPPPLGRVALPHAALPSLHPLPLLPFLPPAPSGPRPPSPPAPLPPPAPGGLAELPSPFTAPTRHRAPFPGPCRGLRANRLGLNPVCGRSGCRGAPGVCGRPFSVAPDRTGPDRRPPALIERPSSSAPPRLAGGARGGESIKGSPTEQPLAPAGGSGLSSWSRV